MRMLTTLFSLVTLLGTATRAPAQWDRQREDVGFDRDCVATATHILVVNSQGSVVDVWKGNARHGEVIPIHALARLTLTQSEHRIPNGIGGGETKFLFFPPWPNEPNGRDRMILFLIKSDAPDPTNALLNGWRPASQNGFGCSYAGVTIAGTVYVRPRLQRAGTGIPDTGLRGSEELFKESVLQTVDRPLPTAAKK